MKYLKLSPYCLTLFIFNLLTIYPARSQSVADIQTIQNAPLEITAPYTTLSSAYPAVVTLQINEPALLSVSAPFPNGFDDPSGTQRSSLLQYNGESAVAGDTLSFNSIGIMEVEVDIQVIRPQPYSPGIYRYDVLLTVIPQ